MKGHWLSGLVTPPPPPAVQRTIKSSKKTVRTRVFVGHAVRYPINELRWLGTKFLQIPKKIRFEQKCSLDKEFVGHGGRGVWHKASVFAFGGAYGPLATAHSDPLWARTCFGCVNGAPG